MYIGHLGRTYCLFSIMTRLLPGSVPDRPKCLSLPHLLPQKSTDCPARVKYKMKKRTLACILILLMLLACPVQGEAAPTNAPNVPDLSISVDPTEQQGGFSAILYNSSNGLPTSEANAIIETSEGFIWIGSYAGLIRYDGNSFERFDSTAGIANVRCLFADSKDRLWIGTNDSGLFLMDKGQIWHWNIEEGLNSSRIRAITEDTDGFILASGTTGITVFDADLHPAEMTDDRISPLKVMEMRPGNDGLVYGVSTDGDLFTLKNGMVVSFIPHQDSPAGTFTAILPDSEHPGYLYIGTDRASVLYGRLIDLFVAEKELDIAPLSDVDCMELIGGKIWICSSDGIGNLDDAGGFNLLESVPMHSFVGHVMADYEGNLWFTSTRQGVMKIVPNPFQDVFAQYSLSAEVVNSTCVAGNRLYIATDNGLIVTEDGKKLDSLPLSEAVTASGIHLEATDLLSWLDGIRIRCLTRDSAGRIWMGTWRGNGLLCYDHGKVTAYTPDDGLFSDQIRTISECENGRILVAGLGGVSIIEQDRVVESYGEQDGIVESDILTAAEGAGHDLILGSSGGGIYIVGSGETRVIGRKDGLKSEVILRIKHSRSKDIYWIVTGNSLAWMTPDYKVTTIQRFPYLNNYDLYENSHGDIWVLASNGIYVTTTETLLANETIESVFFSYPNGLPYTATANSFSDLTEEGDLYIASSLGVVRVNIETSYENVNDQKIAVPFIDADGTRIYPDDTGTFTIPSDIRKLTISSFVFNYSLTNPRVSYYLEGYDNEAVTVNRSELGPVDYTNLRGGDYRFVVQLKDFMGRETREMSVVIHKEKAFYEQIWFVVLAGLAVVALIALAARLYARKKTRVLEKKNQETMTLVREITHAFAKVIDMKDKYTNGHSTRVARYTAMLARELGYDDDTVEKYYQIALLHDIGKIGVPPEVLNKPGKLTDAEFGTIQSHTSQGYEALMEISIMPELAVGAQAHHERPDGKGYPNHLKADEIPRVAQIIAVADCFDAMYSNRPYRKRMNFEKAVSIIQEVSGTQLSTDVVDAFMRLVAKGEFRAPDDLGGGTMENINNIHNAQNA